MAVSVCVYVCVNFRFEWNENTDADECDDGDVDDDNDINNENYVFFAYSSWLSCMQRVELSK